MSITVVNIHKVKGKRPYYDVYIGRAVRNTEFEDDSFWANPFRTTYPNWKEQYTFYIKAKLNLYGWNKLLELDGKILGCWCKPNDCHGDILIDLLENRKRYLEYEKF